MTESKHIIELEMTDGGQLITVEKYYQCFVTKHVVNQQVELTKRKVEGIMCFSHYKFPEVMSGVMKDLMVIQVKCCCEDQFKAVDLRFSNGR